MKLPALNMENRRLTAAVLILASTPGIASLLLAIPDIEGVPPALFLVNPTILLVVMALAGAWAAPKCRFRLSSTRYNALLMIESGLLTGAGIAAFDEVFHPLWAAGTEHQSIIGAWSLPALVSGMLYGGITEEVVMRWGLMSLLTLAALKLPIRRSTAVLSGAILSSLLFAIGHIPAMALAGDLTAAVILRTVILNFVAGSLFAHAFAWRGLVAAFCCHAAFHAGIAAVALSFG